MTIPSRSDSPELVTVKKTSTVISVKSFDPSLFYSRGSMAYRRQKSVVLLLVLAFYLGGMQSNAFGSINVYGGQTHANVDDWDGGYQGVTSSSLSGASVVANLPGLSAAHSSFYGSNLLSHSVGLTRSGDYGDYAHAYGSAAFTAQSNETYSISGGLLNQSGYGYLEVALYDYQAGTYLFRNIQANTGAITLTVGNTAGNYSNHIEGSLTGSIVAGKQYLWRFQALTQTYPTDDNGVTATGGAHITFGNMNVPEPTSFLIWGSTGLLGLVGIRRRRFS